MPAPGPIFNRQMKLMVDGGFNVVFGRVEENLTGGMFRRRTGKMLSNVRANSKKLQRGISIGTTSPALIAWMNGSPRKGYFVRPRTAKVLAFEVGGVRVFSKGHYIPPWTFSPIRPAFTDAFKRSSRELIELSEALFMDGLKRVFTGDEMKVRFRRKGF